MATLIPIPYSLIRAGIFLLLWTVCLAAAAPKISNIVPKRGISEDPSCPDGWLCKSQRCEATCPAGEVCIAFEGTLTCAPEGQTWCALNPGTFEAVECQNGGVCCHGNCYKPGTVCCDNPAIHCAIGDLCLACPGSETCITGASTCAASGTPQSTTIQQTTTTRATATITSGVPVKPTIVQQDGNFKYKGCFVDTVGSRALVVGNRTDASSTGMTVEKCVALAKQQNLRYAGVEVGSQCYFGNTLYTNNKASNSDCSTVCAGAPNELCGEDNRLQVYEDTTWSDPTLDELTEVLLQYNSTLFELQKLTAQYKNLIQRWADQQNSNNKKPWLSRRQSQTITLTELDDGLRDVERRYPELRRLLERAAENGGVIYIRGASRDVIRPGQNNPFIDAPTLENAQHAFDIPLNPIRNVQSAIEDDLQSIADSTTPLLNTARDLQVAGTANNAIGIISGTTLAAIAVGQGLFALLALIFLHLHPSGNTSQPPPSQSHSITVTTTFSATTVSATTSTTSTSTAPQLCSADGPCDGFGCLPTPQPAGRAIPTNAPVKRQLPRPAGNSPAQMDTFVLNEIASAEKVPHRYSPNRIGMSSAVAKQLLDQPFSLAVTGLYGCTAVVVVSAFAIYFTHFFEAPSFQSRENFEEDVLDGLIHGDNSGQLPSLRALASPDQEGAWFQDESRPKIFIITPKPRSGNGDLEYSQKIDQLSDELEQMLPGAPQTIVPYQIKFDLHSYQNTASGKVLFQYDNKDSCGATQYAAYNLWIENDPSPETGSWQALPWQQGEQNSPHKRQACTRTTEGPSQSATPTRSTFTVSLTKTPIFSSVGP